ncbi:MAG TPA: hypothetical protein VKV80_07295 [Streptosporangiaceae bacterium]|nr:hypothetical protein [Streptosporangiaceae bacterium]
MADEAHGGAAAGQAGDDGGVPPEREAADARGTGGPGPVPGGLPGGGPLRHDVPGSGTAGSGLAGDGPAGDSPAGADPMAGVPSGDERVDAVIARLGELAETPLDQHAALLGQVHDRLREVLGELDSGAPGAGSPPPGASGRSPR